MRRYHFSLLVELLFLSTLLICCNSDKLNVKDQYSLVAEDVFLTFPIDDETRIPIHTAWVFEDHGHAYLTFANSRGNMILFYDLELGKLIKKVHFDMEGPNGVGRFGGYSVVDFNHIYIDNLHQPMIFEMDSSGIIRRRHLFSETTMGMPLRTASLGTFVHSEVTPFESKIFVPLSVNLRFVVKGLAEKSPVAILIDTITGEVTPSPLLYAPSVTLPDARSVTVSFSAGAYFDGESFIHSFQGADSVYKVSTDFNTVTSHFAKSRYIDRVKVEVMRESDSGQRLKKRIEATFYRNIIYDPYREVYYRFASPATTVEEGEDYLKILQHGGKSLSIIILDKEMRIVGETLLPDYKYNSGLYFVRPDGLYLSTSHIKNPDFDENLLSFQLLRLVEEEQ